MNKNFSFSQEKYHMVDCLGGRIAYHNLRGVFFFFWKLLAKQNLAKPFAKGLSFVLFKTRVLRIRSC